MPSCAPAVMTALVDLIGATFAADPAVAVTEGHPGVNPLPDLIGVMGVAGTQEPSTMRVGPAAKREETLRVTVVVSCYVGGGPEAQPVVKARAYALLAAIEDAIRADITLGGLVRRAGLVEHELAMDIATYVDESGDEVPMGRVAEISAVIATEARV